MYEELKGKKLLILGGAANEITIVTRAKELGVYTIVTDSNLDRALSPAKNYADEAWDISWSDLDALEPLCRKAGVDGILAGYSEFRVENQIKLCQRLGLPCCTTMEQLDITRNKDKFKNACRQSGVPVVHEYDTPAQVTSFPVIVKPVDRAGSIGISVATNPAELEKAYAYAMDCSVCKHVIVEDFITDGIKIDSYYAVTGGEIHFLTTDDVINAANNGTDKVVQSAWLFPSNHEQEYLETVDPAIRSFIRDIGVRDGYMFFSFFHTPRGIVCFEMGLRLCGGHMYAFLPGENRLNNLDLYLLHALTGTTDSLLIPEAASHKRTVAINLYSKEGTITAIEGLHEMRQREDCCLTVQHSHLGQVCTEDKAILSKIGMAIFQNTDPKALEEDVQALYSGLSVTGAKGEDLIYDRINPADVSRWWNV